MKGEYLGYVWEVATDYWAGRQDECVFVTPPTGSVLLDPEKPAYSEAPGARRWRNNAWVLRVWPSNGVSFMNTVEEVESAIRVMVTVEMQYADK